MTNIIKRINTKLNNTITKKTILIICVLVFVAMLYPIIRVSFYTHPAADDFNYGINTINKVNSVGLFGVILGAAKTVGTFYGTWQGTFSAIFLFALSPSVFGSNCYFLTTIIISVSLFIGVYYLFHSIAKHAKIDNYICLICTILFFLLSIQTLPSITQGLYWWNGASYYMLFFSMELIEIGLLINIHLSKQKQKMRYILLCILSFIIGGGNFITALQQIIILFFLNLYLIVTKKNKQFVAPLIIAIISLGISAIAPGNAYRAASVISMNPIKAIILSFKYAYVFIFEWIKPISILVLLPITLFIVPYIKNIKHNFSYPLIVALFSFCLFSAEFTPTLYSQSSIGEGRLWNIIYISLLLMILVNMVYVVGYFRNVLVKDKVIKTNKLVSCIMNVRFYIFFAFIVVIFSILYFNRYTYTSYITYNILRNGEAQTYDKEYKERQKIFENKNIKKVEFEKYTYTPYPIFYVDYTNQKDHWLNEPVAKIYNKEYVIVLNHEGEENENSK